MAAETIGVLMMAYGSPESLEDVEAYYTHIRGGRTPRPELVQELKERYKLIGGRSNLNGITKEQAEGVERYLHERLGLNADSATEHPTFRTYVGMKHWHPYISETVDRMIEDGIQKGVLLALAPQYSRMSVDAYLNAAREAAEGSPLSFVEIRNWHDHPLFLGFLARRVRRALQQFDESDRPSVQVVFTAHSLPERIREWNDPYPTQLLETAQGVADRVGLATWHFAYQSAGRTPEPWLGPDILTRLTELKEAGAKNVLACPVGFVADHLEIFYDLDYEAKRYADSLGMRFERTASPNADPEFVDALAAIVLEHLGMRERV